MVLPLAVISEAMAYFFDIGWALCFSVPLWLVPAKAPPLTVLTEAGAVALIFFALAYTNTIIGRRKARRASKGYLGDFDLFDQDEPSPFRWPDLNFETLELTVMSRPMEILLGLGSIALLSLSAGYIIPHVSRSWSFVSPNCIIVAAYGDPLIGSDTEREARSDGFRRVATEFTIYRPANVPQLWNETARLVVIEGDSVRTHRRMVECPKPPNG